MIELTVRLTDEQLAEIARRAAALIPSSEPTASPWLNVTDAAERMRCRKDRIYDLIALEAARPVFARRAARSMFIAVKASWALSCASAKKRCAC
jgi:hypothetical protein